MEDGKDTAAEVQQEQERAAELQSPGEWYQHTDYEDSKTFIRTNLKSAARSFIAIGYYLKHIRDGELFREDDHATIWEFAQAEYGISKSAASRYMSMNDRFSQGGNSPLIDSQYKGFDKSKLQEMLSLTDEQLEQVTPEMRVQDIRSMRMPKEIPYFELPGQLDLETDFPEVLPVLVEQTLPEARTFMMNVADLVGDDMEPEEVAGAIAISQQREQVNATQEETEYLEQQDATRNTLDTEFIESTEPEKSGEDLTDLQLAREELEWENNLLRKCLLDVSGEDDICIRRMKIKVAALASFVCDLDDIENPPPEPEQPELPMLRNNDQRKEWLENFRSWPVWFEVPEASEVYYRYDLPDGSSLVICEYHYWADWVERYGYNENPDRTGEREYLLKPEYHYLHNCQSNRSALIDKLKEIQKKGKT